MANPIEVEEAFQQAASDMDEAQSFRYIYSRFFDFAELIGEDAVKYRSYLVQLMDMLPVFTLPITWSGLDPELLARYADEIDDLSEQVQRESPINVVQRLRQAAFLQYICVSEPALAFNEFEKLMDTHLDHEVAPVIQGDESQKNLLVVKEWLLNILSQQPADTKTAKLLRECIHDINTITKEREFGVTIPVVEQNRSVAWDKPEYKSGRLRSLTLHESGVSEGRDKLIRYFPVTGAEPVSEVKEQLVTAVSRALAEKKYPQLAGTFFRAHLHYEINGASHEGQSSDVAVSALWFSYLTEKAETREHVSLTGQAAITGTLNENGVIDGVGADGIKWKVRAAFFSCIDYLVVPQSQYKQFEQELKRLQKIYPSKKCTLIGVNSVEELFYDRRLAQYHYESRMKHSLNKLKKEKFSIIGIPLIIILFLIIVRLMYGPVDQRPASFTFLDNFIEIKNSDGYILKRLLHRDRTGVYITGEAELFDINKDSYREIIYDYQSDGLNNGNPVLRAWTSSGDSLLWQSEINLNYRYPRQLIPDFTNLRVIEIDIGQSADGPRVVVIARSTQYFQGVLLIYDAESGELVSEYVNAGIITDLIVTDRNGDGISEILIVGINNAYWSSFIAEINIDEGQGYSPATADYIPEGIQKANETLYVLLPKSLVGEYLTPIDKYNFARAVRYDPQRMEYLAIVQEGRRYFDGDLFGVDVLFHFDHSLKPTGIGTSDAYDVAARDFYRERKIPFEPDFDYFESLQDSILYWNGEGFVPAREYFSDQSE